MIELSMAEWLTAALMSMTCTLLVITFILQNQNARQAVAWLSIFVGAAASYALFQCYHGENWFHSNRTSSGHNLNLAAFRDCPDCPEMVPLEPGYASLGADAKDASAFPFERPQRVVRIGKPFAMGRTEVTVAQFQKYLTATKRTLGCTGLSANTAYPITCVTLPEARAYAEWLSEYTGQNYRLPSAGEWEYAARAGTTNADVANQASALMPVASVQPNGFGLHDMTGNVAEWTTDCWLPSLRRAPSDGRWATAGGDCSKRVVKDAAWSDEARFSRASARRPLAAATALPSIGFRLVREIRLTH